jgi:hypothetical protein
MYSCGTMQKLSRTWAVVQIVSKRNDRLRCGWKHIPSIKDAGTDQEMPCKSSASWYVWRYCRWIVYVSRRITKKIATSVN